MSSNKITKNIFWLLLEQGSRIVFGLAGAAILARQLGVEQYGLFQYALSLSIIFMSISYICGAEILVPALVDANKKEQKAFMGNAFVVRLVFSILAYFALLLFAVLTEKAAQFYLIALLGTSILFSESFGVITAWLQSQTNSKPRSILVMLAALIKFVLLASLFFVGVTNPMFYGLAWALEIILLALGLCVVYFKLNRSWFFSYSFPVAYGLFKQGLPFFLGLMAMFVFLRLDMVMMRNLTDLHSLGQYAAATQLLNNVLALAPILVMSMAPSMIYSTNKNIKQSIAKICVVLFVVALLCALMIQLLAPYIIPILFGAKYQAAIPIWSALSWAACLFFLNEGLNVYLIKIKRGDLVTIKWLMVLAVAVCAYYYLIPAYQAYGAVMGYAIGYGVSCLFGTIALLTFKVRDNE